MAIKVWTNLDVRLLKSALSQRGLLSKVTILGNSAFGQAEVILGTLNQKQLNVFKSGESRIRWIQLPSVDSKGYVALKGVKVTNIRGLMAENIAETVVGSLLGVYRGIFAAAWAQNKKTWKRWPIRQEADSLRGKKILFLGGGAIVEACMKILKIFDCSFIVYRRKRKKIKNAEVIYKRSCVLDDVRKVNVVINALPSDDKTDDFMDRRFFAACPKGVVVCNVGRGSTVDEKALVAALKAKKIKAAILDVTKIEPLGSKDRLWNVEGLYLMQHIAGGHRNEEKNKCAFFAQNLKRYLTKKPLLNRIS